MSAQRQQRTWRPCQKGDVEWNAHACWSDFDENRIPTGVTEVLADSDLYFPDWRTFPTLDRSRLAGWADECSRCLGASAAPLEDGERDT